MVRMGHLELFPVALQPAAHHPGLAFREYLAKVILAAVEKDEREKTRFVPAAYPVRKAAPGGRRMFVDGNRQCRDRAVGRLQDFRRISSVYQPAWQVP